MKLSDWDLQLLIVSIREALKSGDASTDIAADLRTLMARLLKERERVLAVTA